MQLAHPANRAIIVNFEDENQSRVSATIKIDTKDRTFQVQKIHTTTSSYMMQFYISVKNSISTCCGIKASS